MHSATLTIFYWIFLLASVVMPLLIVARSVCSYRQVGHGRGKFVLKAVIALAIWSILTLVMALVESTIAAVSRAADTIDPNSGDIVFVGEVAGLHLVYVLAGCGLVYWIVSREKIRLD
jgi:uncharacterized Tic20 family protein